MATYKRRVVYLSDEEWSKVNQRAKAFNVSSSAYIRKLIEWRQPGPWYREHLIDASLEKEFGHLTDLDVQPLLANAIAGQAPERGVRPFTEFRPAPKSGRKS